MSGSADFQAHHALKQRIHQAVVAAKPSKYQITSTPVEDATKAHKYRWRLEYEPEGQLSRSFEVLLHVPAPDSYWLFVSHSNSDAGALDWTRCSLKGTLIESEHLASAEALQGLKNVAGAPDPLVQILRQIFEKHPPNIEGLS